VLVHACGQGPFAHGLLGLGHGIPRLQHGGGGVGRVCGLVLGLVGQGHGLAVGQAW